MRGTIDLAALHGTSAGDRVTSQIAKIAAANPPEQIEIDHNTRLLPLFGIYCA